MKMRRQSFFLENTRKIQGNWPFFTGFSLTFPAVSL
jgi:hypothetical protein